MALTPEEQARKTIDEALHNAGWDVQDVSHVNVHAAQGVAIREFPLKAGYGTADYLLYVNGKAAGALEAKKEGTTLSGVEIQTEKYSEGCFLPSLRMFVPYPFSTKALAWRHFLPIGSILTHGAVVSFTSIAQRSSQNGYRQNPKPLASPPPFGVVSNTCPLSSVQGCGLRNGLL